MTTLANDLTDAQIETLARHRASASLGWLTHAFAFVGINLFLATIALANGHARPFGIATFAWAFGLAVHGVVVLARGRGASLAERLVARQRARLLAERDPW